jgi:hypothetical protein
MSGEERGKFLHEEYFVAYWGRPEFVVEVVEQWRQRRMLLKRKQKTMNHFFPFSSFISSCETNIEVHFVVDVDTVVVVAMTLRCVVVLLVAFVSERESCCHSPHWPVRQ